MATPGYLTAVRGILDHLEQTQLPAIEQAADYVVAALSNGGAVFCAEIGHGNQGDFLNRAGGLLALQPFHFNIHLNDPVADCLRKRPQPEAFSRELENIRHAVKVSNLRAGDVLLVSSVSGKNTGPIELALAARAKGVRVIGFTSLQYTANVTSHHPSGQKLCDVVDVVIDNGAPYGDAAVAIPGFDFNLLPVSGASMIVAGWLIWERVIEKMTANGTPPSVFMSYNRAGGPEFNEAARKTYAERGY